ncbi:MAG: hypothetical protein A4E32_01086 [Methanomassiliicoccales archaeon PtaU1.Bin124]|nr:MAG: hypothetical protein A4E32_01086 [Methanomassiliicoccales archaeon PtaU1.Bin124]
MVELLANVIIPKALKEFHAFFPNATAKFYLDGEGRGVIKILDGEYLIGLEFIETETSWSSKKRMWEYYVALVNKCRLVVYVPQPHAMPARMRMLEFNQHWLNYYLVYSYDSSLAIEKIGRPRVLPHTPLRAGAMPLGGYL